MTSNPMLKVDVARNDELSNSRPMTIEGTVNKTLILIGLVILTGIYTWNLCSNGFADKAMMLVIGGTIAGLILALITAFKPHNAKITAPVYAICEGLVVGAISFSYNALYNGIVVSAAEVTILALLSMLLLYKTKVIRATEKFRQVIVISTLAIGIFYIAGIIGALFGHPMTIFNGSLIGIGISFVFCAIAALNFILDFDFIERGAREEYPSYMEWYGGFALLVTVVWLYLELLRLLAQLQNRK